LLVFPRNRFGRTGASAAVTAARCFGSCSRLEGRRVIHWVCLINFPGSEVQPWLLAKAVRSLHAGCSFSYIGPWACKINKKGRWLERALQATRDARPAQPVRGSYFRAGSSCWSRIFNRGGMVPYLFFTAEPFYVAIWKVDAGRAAPATAPLFTRRPARRAT
jgi:hypothetical protein